MYCGTAGLLNPSGSCDAGFYCSGGANRSSIYPADSTGGPCPVGFLCPGNSAPVPCSIGFYQNFTGQSTCLTCPAGFYCNASALGAPVVCPLGYFCPSGTSTNFIACPAGTFDPRGGLTDVTDCMNCTAGQYCPTPGQNSTAGLCAAGYYCPGSNTDAFGGDRFAGAAARPCPIGAYCPQGSVVPSLCPPGTLQGGVQKTSISDCDYCPEGMYCSAAGSNLPSGLCAAGYYCQRGVSTPTPRVGITLAGNIVIGGDLCPPAAFCPQGSTSPSWCPAGTYNNLTGVASNCTACPASYYCPANTSDYSSNVCPAGSFCPGSTTSPISNLCPTGTYNPWPGAASAASCVACNPGSYCSSPGASAATGPCAAGYLCLGGATMPSPSDGVSGMPCSSGDYCPIGSSAARPCPAGAYCSSATAVNGSCNAGYYCLPGSFTATPSGQVHPVWGFIGDICPQGHFCLSGTITPEPCRNGTFNPSTGAVSSTQCQACTPGRFCNASGLIQPGFPCFAGYICPGGTVYPNLLCPPGNFCPAGSSNATQCPAGTFQNASGTSQCDRCPSGFYCTLGLASPLPCPAGYYCPAGSTTGTANPCPVSTYSARLMLSAASQCEACPAGYYCDALGLTAPTGPCTAGYYCVANSNTSTPTDGTRNGYFCQLNVDHVDFVRVGTGDICPTGHYCPSGSGWPHPCSPGTYINTTGNTDITDCLPCSPGYVCPDYGLSFAVVPCPAGYICRGGNINGTEETCPLGSYCPTGSSNSSLCSPGTYAGMPGLATCSPCPPRTYCLAGQVVPSTCPAGDFCPQGTSTPQSFPCPVGTFSNRTGLANASECSLCVPSMYCAAAGSIAPTAPCAAGYYCNFNSSTATPTDGVTGQRCPPGSYCPSGSSAPVICPPGTFSATSGNTALSNCTACLSGFSCPNAGQAAVSVPCLPGFYCPGGDAVPSLLCPAGSSCAGGNGSPIPCLAGTYAPVGALSVCDLCPAGFYCPTQTITPIACPAGYFCPEGSSSGTSHPCPLASYSNRTMLASPDECAACPAGFYCGGLGLTQPSGPCAAGYYCVGNASTSAPMDGTTNGYTCQVDVSTVDFVRVGTGDVCPTGHYCPAGSGWPHPCRPGTFLNVTGESAAADCLPCSPGYMCPDYGTRQPSTLCPPGYVCQGGNVNGTELACPLGNYCALGSSNPAPCPAGSYADVLGLPSCWQCPARQYCLLGQQTPMVCPAGYYCPKGTASATAFPCPDGTFNNRTGLATVSECSPCLPGQYCGIPGLTAPTGPCSAGYICGFNSAVPAPTDGVAGSICPPGAYCPSGSSGATLCPPGYFRSTSGGMAVTDCTICTAGKLCPNPGLTIPSAPCTAGFYCGVGTRVANVSCPAGHFCPTGSANPTACDPGLYQPSQGQSSCETCPSGFYCPLGTAIPTLCPPGAFCPMASTIASGNLCPSGTFRNASGGQSLADCWPCPPGVYCGSAGLAEPTGPCDVGFLCVRGAASSNPSAPPGFSCTAGPFEDYEGDICPVGHYCPLGSSYPRPCALGTFLNETGGQAAADCFNCTPGWICARLGLAGPSGLCPAGYYCSGGDIDGYNFACPPGQYCLAGSLAPTPCPAGTFNPANASTSCSTCPPRSYCPQGASLPLDCPAGYYCPPGSTIPDGFPCPVGTFSNRTMLADVSECVPCPRGKYCDSPAALQPSGQCQAGFVCLGGAVSNVPVDSTGFQCNPGTYCPTGTVGPLPCPPGTYSPTVGNPDASFCLSCPPGLACPDLAMTAPGGACPAGFYCPGGNVDGTEDACPQGQFCPAGRAIGIPCLPGTYADQEGLAACKTCPARFFCPVGTAIPQNCPPGYVCTGGDSAGFGTPCPPGTYSNVSGLASVSECRPCLPGQYCATPGLLQPTGYCGPSYYCIANSTSPQPSDGITGGQCAGGFVCEKGSYTPVPILGVGGPFGNGTGYACPPGTFCPTGAVAPIPCGPSTFNPAFGQSSCLSCLAGGSCPGGTARPQPCPPFRYCPAGSSIGNYCPDGTYSLSQTNFSAPDHCLPCPSGYYCQFGNVSALCKAGYFCRSAQGVPDPSANFGMPVNMSLAGGLCPLGHYCPKGTVIPSPCPNGTFRAIPGGASASDCGACPLGYLCFPGNPVPLACSPGNYCPSGQLQLACPSGTYNPFAGKSNDTDCLECPAGYQCNVDGIGSLQPYVCPPGLYCLSGTINATACPPASYRPSGGARAISECSICLGGQLCPYAGMTTGLPCAPGFYCPAGSVNMTQCPAGYYCSGGSANPTLCPAAHYCPLGSEMPLFCPQYRYCPAGSTTPSSCPAGMRALLDTSNLTRAAFAYACESCPLGTYNDIPGSAVCVQCPAGYVCLGGTPVANPVDPLVDFGFACQPGFYCPAGSAQQRACPPGTVNANSTMSNLTDCIACAADEFQDEAAQTSCKLCSASSYSFPDATTCTCLGKFRDYQITDGSCICQTGYEYVDQFLNVLSNVDSIQDCQPIVYSVCFGGTARAADGSCLPLNDNSMCEQQCPTKRGTYNSGIGLCECEGLTPVQLVCNSECQANAPSLTIDPSTGLVRIDEGGNKTLFSPSSIPGLVGNFSCIPGLRNGLSVTDATASGIAASLATATLTEQDYLDSSCKLVTVSLDSDGFTGVYGLPSGILSALSASQAGNSSARRLTEDVSPLVVSRASARLPSFVIIQGKLAPGHMRDAKVITRLLSFDGPDRSRRQQTGALNYRRDFGNLSKRFGRNLVTSGTTADSPGVQQPVVCIRLGDGVAFDISPSNYPVYEKNSLLNTNPTFDFGQFRQLELLAQQQNYSTFIFTFIQSGLYTFSQSADPTKIMVLAVMAPGSQCPTDAPIVPMTASTLIQLGAKVSPDILVAINWKIVVGVVVSLVLAVLLTVWGARYIQHRKWTGVPIDHPKYRVQSSALPLDKLHNKGSIVKAEMKTDSEDLLTEDAGQSTINLLTTSSLRDTGHELAILSPKSVLLKPIMPQTTRSGSTKQGLSLDTLLGRAGNEQSQLVVADIENWDDDDLDLREIIERLENHAGTIRAGFIQQSEKTQELMQAVHAEASTIKSLLGRSSFEQTLLMATAEDEVTRKANLSQAFSDEINARAAFDRRVAQVESTLMSAFSLLQESMRFGPDAVSAQIVEDLKGARRLELVTTIERLRQEILDVQTAIDSLFLAISDEANRRRNTVPVWHLAAEMGALADNPSMMQMMERLQDCETAAEQRVSRVLAAFEEFAQKAPNIQQNLHEGAGLYWPRFRAAVAAVEREKTALDYRSPAVAAAARAGGEGAEHLVVQDDGLEVPTSQAELPQDEQEEDEEATPVALRPAAIKAVKLHKSAHSRFRNVLRELAKLLHMVDDDVKREADKEDISQQVQLLRSDVASSFASTVERTKNAFKGIHTEPERNIHTMLGDLLATLHESVKEPPAGADGTGKPGSNGAPNVQSASSDSTQPSQLLASLLGGKESGSQSAGSLERRQEAVVAAQHQAAAAAQEQVNVAYSARKQATVQLVQEQGHLQKEDAIKNVKQKKDQIVADAVAAAQELLEAASLGSSLPSATLNPAAEQGVGEPAGNFSSGASELLTAVAQVIAADVDAEAKALEAVLNAEQERQAKEVENKVVAAAALDAETSAKLATARVSASVTKGAADKLSSLYEMQAQKLQKIMQESGIAEDGAVPVEGRVVEVGPATPDPFAVDTTPEAMLSSLRETVARTAEAASADYSQELERLRKQFEEENRALKASVDQERARQRADLAAKMEKRRAGKFAAARAKHAEELVQLAASSPQGPPDHAIQVELLKQQEAEISQISANLAAADTQDAKDLEQALSQGDGQLEEKARKLREAYDQEKLALQEKLAKERARQMERLQQKLLDRKQRALSAPQRPQMEAPQVAEVFAQAEKLLAQMPELERQVLARTYNAEEKAEQIRRAYEAEKDALANALDDERRRQDDALQKRMLERKLKRELALRVKREAAIAAAAEALQSGANPSAVVQQFLADAVAEDEAVLQDEAIDKAKVASNIAELEKACKAKQGLNSIDVQAKLDEVRATHAGEQFALTQALVSERQRQHAQTQLRLQERKAKKLRQLSMEQERELQKQSAIGNEGDSSAAQAEVEQALNRSDVVAAVEQQVVEKAAQLEIENERRKQELMAKQAEERSRLEAEAAEAQRLAQQRARQLQEEQRAKVKAKRAEMEARLSQMGSTASEEADRIRREHEKELASYESSVEEERRRQQEKLQAQLEMRKAKKLRELQRKQEEEMAQETQRQSELAKQLQQEAEREKEKAALAAVLTQSKQDTQVIELVMRKRHAKETSDVIAKQYADRTNRLTELVEKSFGARREAKAAMLASLHAAGASEAEISAALSNLEATFDAQREVDIKAAMEDMEASQANDQMLLRQRQLAEISNAYKELAPEDVLIQHAAEEAAREAREVANFQLELEQARQQRIAKIKAEKEAFEVKLRQENDEQLQKLEAEHQAQLNEERRRVEDQLRIRKERLAKEQEELRKKKLAESSSLDMETRDKIMREFEENTANLERKLEDVRTEQTKKLEAKLALRKAKKLAQAQKDIREKMSQEEAKAAERITKENEAARGTLQAVQATVAEAQSAVSARAAEVKDADTQEATAPSVLDAAQQSTVGDTQVDSAETRPNAAEDSSAHVPEAGEASKTEGKGKVSKKELAKRIIKMEALLREVVGSQDVAPASGASKSVEAMQSISGRGSIDTAGDGILIEANIEDLNPRQSLRFEFLRSMLRVQSAAEQAGRLKLPRQMPSLKLASSFPLPEDAAHTFQSTFLLRPQANILYVRASSLNGAADLLVNLSHVLALIMTSPSDFTKADKEAVASHMTAIFGALTTEYFKNVGAKEEAPSRNSISATPPPAGPVPSAATLTAKYLSVAAEIKTPQPLPSPRSATALPLATASYSRSALEARLKMYSSVVTEPKASDKKK